MVDHEHHMVSTECKSNILFPSFSAHDRSGCVPLVIVYVVVVFDIDIDIVI